MTIREQAAYDVWCAVERWKKASIVRRHVGWIEPQYAHDRGVTGKRRGRYQRAFHAALRCYRETT